MISKLINSKQFKEAIRVAFDGDRDIFALYAPHIPVKNLDDIVNDISGRVGRDEDLAILKGVYNKDNLIGYFVYRNKMLISFALNKKYRTRNYLREFFKLMRDDLKGRFICFLWSRNERAIRWLCKNGMTIMGIDTMVTQLEYKG